MQPLLTLNIEKLISLFKVFSLFNEDYTNTLLNQLWKGAIKVIHLRSTLPFEDLVFM